MNSSLSLQALRYGHRQPLFAPLTLACRPGEIWAVLGANGRGKSTLLDTLTGVLPPLGGEMQCEGGVALVPQSFRPAFRWRVSDVVLMGRARHVDLFAQPDEEDARRVEQALAQLGIAALAEDDFGALSGGQQQLVLIARALVSASQNILLDEPCSALDLGNQQVVLQLTATSPTARRAPSCSPPMIPTTPYRWPAIRCFCCRRAGGWRARPPTC